MNRVVVVGASGSGKTTLARDLAGRLRTAYVELDGLLHGPGWTQREEFPADVAAAVAEPAWVIDGNYSDVRDVIWPRADTVVWLDYPRTFVLRRVLWRTARRVVTREPLWNGNRERWWTVLSAEHPIRWGWSKAALYREEYTARAAAFPRLTLVRLRSPRDAQRWLDTVSVGD